MADNYIFNLKQLVSQPHIPHIGKRLLSLLSSQLVEIDYIMCLLNWLARKRFLCLSFPMLLNAADLFLFPACDRIGRRR